MSKNTTCKALLVITLLLVLSIFVKVYFNPHFEQETCIKNIHLGDGILECSFGECTYAEVNTKHDMICDDGAEILYDYAIGLRDGHHHGNCAIKTTCKKIRFGETE